MVCVCVTSELIYTVYNNVCVWPSLTFSSCLCLCSSRRHRVVARSGAAFIPLGPGQKAAQPVHHRPPQRYQTGSLCVCVCVQPLSQNSRIRATITDRKCHLVDERAWTNQFGCVCSVGSRGAAEPSQQEGDFKTRAALQRRCPHFIHVQSSAGPEHDHQHLCFLLSFVLS